MTTADQGQSIASALLVWYGRQERDIPWRGDRDPYRVWVGEVMAQQTRLGVVRPYYHRFIEHFPDLESLASAELDDVLKAWEGLGYYARARNLAAAAREVVAAYGGDLPATAGALRGLPGVGRYIAGAVASIAFGESEPAVDANSRRVLSRLFDLARPTPVRLEARARSLLGAAPGRAAELNQALMDLGATVCRSVSPLCGECPVRAFCAARARGTVAGRPPPRGARALPHYSIAAAVVWRRGRVLIARRPEDGLLGGLWEFPGGKIEPGESAPEAARREVREEMGIAVEVGDLIDAIRHTYSHFRITLHAYHAAWVSGKVRARSATAWRWVEPRLLSSFAWPAANRRIVARLEAAPGRQSG